MVATLAELEAELAKVNASVSAAYTGAEYEIHDGQVSRKLKRQSLDLLLRRKAELELCISRTNGTGRGVSHGLPVDNNSLLNRVV